MSSYSVVIPQWYEGSEKGIKKAQGGKSAIKKGHCGKSATTA